MNVKSIRRTISKDPMYATPIKRLGAYMIDVFIIACFSFVIQRVLVNYGIEFSIYKTKAVLENGLSVLKQEVNLNGYKNLFYLFNFVNYTYFVLFLCSKKQASIGNQFLKIMVVDINVIRIRPLTAIIRCISTTINSQIYYIGLLTYYFRNDGAFLNDIMSNTNVINLSK
jgi:uncharacterized RDD family membrane protein YckC